MIFRYAAGADESEFGFVAFGVWGEVVQVGGFSGGGLDLLTESVAGVCSGHGGLRGRALRIYGFGR
ncbi:MAG: hypothetical protein RI897_4178 [Verrucomicrobiota bacterium]